MNKVNYILTSNYSPWSRYSGGGQKSTHQIAIALANLGYSVNVVFTKAPWETVRLPHNLPYRINFALFLGLRPGISSPFRFLNGLTVWLKVFFLSNPHTIIIGNGDESSLLGLIHQKSAFWYTNRYPLFPSQVLQLNWSTKFWPIQLFIIDPRFCAMAIAARTATKILFTSQSSLNHCSFALKLHHKERHILANGIDPLYVQSELAESGQLGFLFFGRVTEGKGADLIVDAYNILPPEIQSIHHLYMIGEGPLKPNLIELSKKKSNSIHFFPWMSAVQLIEIMQKSRLIILPSREESFGNTMLETLALGHHLITTQVGSIPEITQNHALELVMPNVQHLVNSIQRHCQTKLTPEVIYSRKNYVQTNYSWETTAKKLIELSTQ